MQVISAMWRGSQGGTGILERSEVMPGKSFTEATVTRKGTQPLHIISTADLPCKLRRSGQMPAKP